MKLPSCKTEAAQVSMMRPSEIRECIVLIVVYVILSLFVYSFIYLFYDIKIRYYILYINRKIPCCYVQLSL